MASTLPIPPYGTPFIDPRSNGVHILWQNYLLELEQSLSGNVAPSDAQYLVATANPDLTNERNLGELTTGFLFLTVAAGIATPSSTLDGSSLTNLNATELATGLVGLARGGLNADISATGGTSQVLKQSSAGASITVGQLASTDISDLASGTYTPTLTNVANVASSTAAVCQYSRVGSVVTVSGQATIDPTSATTLTQLGISLPIASDFASAPQCGGTAATAAVAGYSAAIAADATNNRAELSFTTATDVASRVWAFVFAYSIV